MWIVDGFTTTSRYPYAQRALIEDTAVSGLDGRFNYIRNSVKAVVDAYEGTVDFYVIDHEDPILQAYQQAFPDLFTTAEPSAELASHFRYPEDLFRLQSNMWGRYHLSNPDDFYNNIGAWVVSRDPGAPNASSPTPTTTHAGGRAAHRAGQPDGPVLPPHPAARGGGGELRDAAAVRARQRTGRPSGAHRPSSWPAATRTTTGSSRPIERRPASRSTGPSSSRARSAPTTSCATRRNGCASRVRRAATTATSSSSRSSSRCSTCSPSTSRARRPTCRCCARSSWPSAARWRWATACGRRSRRCRSSPMCPETLDDVEVEDPDNPDDPDDPDEPPIGEDPDVRTVAELLSAADALIQEANELPASDLGRYSELIAEARDLIQRAQELLEEETGVPADEPGEPGDTTTSTTPTTTTSEPQSA